MRFLKYIFCALLFVTASFAETININWMNDDETYAQTTCEIGGDLILPEPPTKRGYTFVGWQKPGYTRLEYIESTGTQYIDTGIKYNSETMDTVSIDFVFDGPLDYDNKIFGSWSGVGITISGSKIRSAHKRSWGWNLTTPIVGADTHIEFKSNSSGIKLYINDNEIEDFATEPFVSDQNMFIGRMNPETSFANYVKIKNVKIGDAFNGIPAKRDSDGAIGMYDTVSGTFFTNAGTGSFIAGPDL